MMSLGSRKIPQIILVFGLFLFLAVNVDGGKSSKNDSAHKHKPENVNKSTDNTKTAHGKAMANDTKTAQEAKQHKKDEPEGRSFHKNPEKHKKPEGHKKPDGQKIPLARMDARVAVSGDDTKEKIPTKQALFTADLKKGEISPPDPDAYPGLSEYQREKLRCKDTSNIMHPLASTYLLFGAECTYYECEYNADINGASWMLSRDIYKCCFEEKHGYKENAVMQGKCTKKVCVRDGEDNSFNGSLAWEFRGTGCKQCTIGLVMLEHNETFHTGDPCLTFRCNDKGKLEPVVNHTCCHVNESYIADGQLAMTRVEQDCEVSTCKAGHFTNKTNYQPLIDEDDYVSGCPVYWSQIQGMCYHSFTKPLTLLEAARHCSILAPARNSQLMRVHYGGMIGTMSDVMELGRWYWLVMRTTLDSPRFMWDKTTTPERFLVGHHEQPTVKRVNYHGKLAFQRAESDRNAYICQMDHRPSCKPTGYTERPPPKMGFREEF